MAKNRKKIGIITIHRIYNYGSVLQAYALQEICRFLGFDVEIIDYMFPNSFHIDASQNRHLNTYQESIIEKIYRVFFKVLYSYDLLKQHKGITNFVNRYLSLSSVSYATPEDLKNHISHYDIYLTGSDQIWNPRYTKGDESFFFGFLDNVKKVAYSSSFGISEIPVEYRPQYAKYLNSFSSISVREKAGVKIIRNLLNRNATLVLDPTLLLDKYAWNKLSKPPKCRKRYILCYFLNYTFNSFPYVDKLAEYISAQTGLRLIKLARPPQKIVNRNTLFNVGASPEEFLGLIANAELVLTTSFHGTAFAINYNKPFYAIVQSRESTDSRLISLLDAVGLTERILYKDEDVFPKKEDVFKMPDFVEKNINELRNESINFLRTSL